MDISSLIALFGEQAGTPLSLNAGGTLALAFANALTINLEHDAAQDVLHLYAVVGQEPASADARSAFYRQLLVANTFGHDTGGASLGIDDDTGDVLLTVRLPLAAADVGTLREAVQSMVAVAAGWRDRLAAPAAPIAAAPAPYANPMASFDFRA